MPVSPQTDESIGEDGIGEQPEETVEGNERDETALRHAAGVRTLRMTGADGKTAQQRE